MGTDPNSSRSEFIPVSCNHSLTRAFLGCLVTGGGGGGVVAAYNSKSI